jgi:Phage integrase, N-terminal SAM-like domain
VTTFQQCLRDELVRRNYSPTTIRSYLHALGTCEQYHRRRRIDRLGPDALRRYQAYLFEEKKLAVGTVGLHVAALRFFFVRVLKRRELKEELPTPKRLVPITALPEVPGAGAGALAARARTGAPRRTVCARRLHAPACAPALVQHILPRGFVRIRQSGFLANTCRAARVTLARTLLATPPAAAAIDAAAPVTEAPPRTTWACPRCGAAMIVGPILSVLQLATAALGFDTS